MTGKLSLAAETQNELFEPYFTGLNECHPGQLSQKDENFFGCFVEAAIIPVYYLDKWLKNFPLPEGNAVQGRVKKNINRTVLKIVFKKIVHAFIVMKRTKCNSQCVYTK